MKLTLLPIIGFRKRDSITKTRMKSKIRQATLKKKKEKKKLSKSLKGKRE